jgi:hypothetical protein
MRPVEKRTGIDDGRLTRLTDTAYRSVVLT